jgi:hypothetical protein
MSSWTLAFTDYITGDWDTLTGELVISDFDRKLWALEKGIRIGPMSGGTENMAMEKLLTIVVTDGTTGDIVEYNCHIDKFTYNTAWQYTPAMSIVTDKQDVGMSLVIQPSSGMYLGNIYASSERMHPVFCGIVDSANAVIPSGTLTQRTTVPYIFRSSIDQNDTAVICSNVDRMKRVLFSCPAAWAGTQTANTELFILNPRNLDDANPLIGLEVIKVVLDEVAPDPAVCVGLWDEKQTLGESNIWASGTANEFYLMEWNGATWVKASPANFVNPGVNGGVLCFVEFGTNLAGNDWMVVGSHRSGIGFWGANNLIYWEHTGGGNRNDPANWTSEIMYDGINPEDTIPGIWDWGTEVNNRTVFRAINTVEGDVYRYQYNGAAWVRIIINVTTVRSQENVGFQRMRNTNLGTGLIEADSILISGRKGFNSQNHCIFEYDLDGNQVSVYQESKQWGPLVGANSTMMNTIY